MKVKNKVEFTIGVKCEGIQYTIPYDGNIYTIPDAAYETIKELVEVIKGPKQLSEFEIRRIEKDNLNKDKPLYKLKNRKGRYKRKCKIKFKSILPKRKRIKKYSAIYTLIDPIGNVYENIDNLKEFCENHLLIHTNVIRQYLQGKDYLGWKISRTIKE